MRELTIAIHWAKAAPVQSKHLMASQEKGRLSQSPGMLQVNTRFEGLSDSHQLHCERADRHEGIGLEPSH